MSRNRRRFSPEYKYGGKETSAQDAAPSDLHEQIGRLKIELEWLKKELLLSVETKRSLIEPAHPVLRLRHQCELLGLNRSSLYDEPAGESQENLRLMRRIDEQYLRGAPWAPFYG